VHARVGMIVSAEMVATLFGSGGVAAVAGSVASYLKGKAAGKASFLNAVQAAAQQVIEAMRGEIDRLSTKVEACEDKHERCERSLEEMRGQIARMMAAAPLAEPYEPQPQPPRPRR
jgi:peptidoglycan hydrolase CwlO-like protein